MIALSTAPTANLPDIHAAANNSLAAGSVFVLREVNGSLVSQLPDGVHVVLQTPAGERLELTTRAAIGAMPGVAGTYLNPEDAARIARHDTPTLRRYASSDTWRKVWTPAGRLLLAPALLAVVTAAVGVYFAIMGTSGGGSATTQKAQNLVTWVRQPTDGLTDATSPTAVEAAGAELQRRATAATFCLQQIQGNQSPTASVPGITCSADRTPWWRSRATGVLVTGVTAVVTAALGVVSLNGKYGFGKNPQS